MELALLPIERRPEIKITRWDLLRLDAWLASYGAARSWRVMEFLVRELIRATIVEDDELPPNTVTMGSKVEFREEGSKTNKVVTLVHPNESEFYDDAISVLSPAGAALIGLSEGQSISYGAPGGLLTTVTVVKVLYQPEANRRVEY